MENRSSQFKDFYYILGIGPDATTEEIRDAYDDLYDKYGPHVSIGGRDPDTVINTFKDLTEAFETLTDPEKRKHYDQTNLPHLQKTHLRELWGKLTGVDTSKDSHKQQEAETRVQMEITLKEALRGVLKKMRVDDQSTCSHCAGQKPVDRLRCPYCRGSGTIASIRDEELELPPGTYDGYQVRRPGRGKMDLRSQRNADLVIEIKIKTHPFFSVLGRDIACTVPVTIYEAVLGGEIQVPTATGKVFLKIQPLTQSGRVYRLRGLGLSGADQLVTIEVAMPSQISADEVALFRKLKESSTLPNPRDALFQKLDNA